MSGRSPANILTRLDKSDEENAALIRKAIEDNNAIVEARLSKLEEKGKKEKDSLNRQEQAELISKLINKKLANKDTKVIPEATPVAQATPNPPARQGYAEISSRTVENNAAKHSSQLIRPENSKKGDIPIIEEKPSKFMDADHKRRTEISFHKKKLIMRVTMEDFLPHIKNYTESMSEDYVLKNPVTYSNRVTAIKYKIYNATGIPPHQLNILRVSKNCQRNI